MAVADVLRAAEHRRHDLRGTEDRAGLRVVLPEQSCGDAGDVRCRHRGPDQRRHRHVRPVELLDRTGDGDPDLLAVDGLDTEPVRFGTG
jgi:hypothetical protein